MANTIETTIAVQADLFKKVERLAHELNMTAGQLFETAVEEFIRRYESQAAGQGVAVETQSAAQRGLIVNQGDIYWVQLEDGDTGEAGIRHPHVVVQADVLNHSRVTTVVACALTTNLERIRWPGNVLLEAGEGNLSKSSVVEVSKVSALEKGQLGGYIGSVSRERVGQILAGMRFLEEAFFGGRSGRNLPHPPAPSPGRENQGRGPGEGES